MPENKMKDCNHTIGFKYGEEYGSSSGEIIDLESLNFSPISYIDTIKEEGELFNFCPDCGAELAPLIKVKLKNLKAKKTREKNKKEKEKAQKDKIFNNHLEKMANYTGLNTLKDNVTYYIKIQSLSPDPRNVVISGKKESVLKTITSYSLNKNNPVILKEVLICPTYEELKEHLKKEGWDTETRYFIKKEKYLIEADYSDKDGLMFVTIKDRKDSIYPRDYMRYSLVDFLKEYNINLKLESLNGTFINVIPINISLHSRTLNDIVKILK